MSRIALMVLASVQMTACTASVDDPGAAAKPSPAVAPTPTAAVDARAQAAKPPVSAPAAPATPAIVEPSDGQAVRIGGDLAAKVEFRDGNFYSGPCSITTPLPAGYPAPTPPGAIEIKRYPAVRRAEVSGTMTPDLGMNMAFFPLFNHIKDRKIAMTSPVEMEYSGVDAPKTPTDPPARPEGWKMSFLYRTPELGPTGQDETRKQVRVIDAPAVTVVSIGIRGSQSWSRVRRESLVLEEWLAGQTEWEAAGDLRGLYYNGPDVRLQDLWGEVQVPVRRRAAAQPTTGR